MSKQTPLTTKPETLLRLPQVKARVGLGRSAIYQRISQGTFPAPVPLGNPHAVAWPESAIENWIQACINSGRPTA